MCVYIYIYIYIYNSLYELFDHVEVLWPFEAWLGDAKVILVVPQRLQQQKKKGSAGGQSSFSLQVAKKARGGEGWLLGSEAEAEWPHLLSPRQQEAGHGRWYGYDGRVNPAPRGQRRLRRVKPKNKMKARCLLWSSSHLASRPPLCSACVA